jgi:hypothetical protein
MAKKKRAAKPMDAHTRATLHQHITRQVTTLISRCGWLRDQGRLDEARRMLARIERVTEELTKGDSIDRATSIHFPRQ